MYKRQALLQPVGHGQRIDDRRQHAHVVGPRAVSYTHLGRRARDGRDEDACRERRQEHQNEDQKRHADGGHE